MLDQIKVILNKYENIKDQIDESINLIWNEVQIEITQIIEACLQIDSSDFDGLLYYIYARPPVNVKVSNCSIIFKFSVPWHYYSPSPLFTNRGISQVNRLLNNKDFIVSKYLTQVKDRKIWNTRTCYGLVFKIHKQNELNINMESLYNERDYLRDELEKAKDQLYSKYSYISKRVFEIIENYIFDTKMDYYDPENYAECEPEARLDELDFSAECEPEYDSKFTGISCKNGIFILSIGSYYTWEDVRCDYEFCESEVLELNNLIVKEFPELNNHNPVIRLSEDHRHDYKIIIKIDLEYLESKNG